DYGEHCHPNCDCGRFFEICNNVFMAYKKEADGKFVPLKAPNIDCGPGLERIAAASEGSGDIFKTSLIWPIIQKLEALSGKKYSDNPEPMRIIADHLRATTWLAVDGVIPSNTAQGYVMRRFLRRAIRQALSLGLQDDFFERVVPVITKLYRDDYPEFAKCEHDVIKVLMAEETQFRKTLVRGVKEFEKMTNGQTTLTGKLIFTLFDTYGFPSELSLEEAHDKKITIDDNWKQAFDAQLTAQKDRSRTATVGQFKGGLADHSDTSIKYHTATHLMYKALRLVLGDHVIQRGSNITPERLRFDFSHGEKMTPEQLAQVEQLVNANIAKDW